MIYDAYTASVFTYDQDTEKWESLKDLGDDHWTSWVLECTKCMSLAAQLGENGHSVQGVDKKIWRNVYEQLMTMSDSFAKAIDSLSSIQIYSTNPQAGDNYISEERVKELLNEGRDLRRKFEHNWIVAGANYNKQKLQN